MTDDSDLDYDLAHEIAEDEIRTFVRTACATELAGLGNLGDEPAQRRAIERMQHLALAEPWLPAAAIIRRLRDAGLLPPPDAGGQ